jgi:hypothetical protein
MRSERRFLSLPAARLVFVVVIKISTMLAGNEPVFPFNLPLHQLPSLHGCESLAIRGGGGRRRASETWKGARSFAPW